MNALFGQKIILEKINESENYVTTSLQYSSHLQTVRNLIEGNADSWAAFKLKNLQRYHLLPGKVFAKDIKSKEKFKILRLIADDVVYKDINSDRVMTKNVNALLLEWDRLGLKEISFVDEVLKVVKQVLGPLLGVFLTSVLIGWLSKNL